MPAKHIWTFKPSLGFAPRHSDGMAQATPAEIGWLAIQRILEGQGYEMTVTDVIDDCNRFMTAAQKLEIAAQARNDVLSIATKAKQGGAPFSDTLIRQCSWIRRCMHLQEKQW